MIKTCIFDFDGTLVDTLEDISGGINYCLKKKGYPERPISDYNSIVGGSHQDMIREALPEGTRLSDEEIAEMENFSDSYYKEHFFDHAKPYPHVHEMLERLNDKDINICIISNKPIEYMVPMITEYFPGVKFEHIIGANTGFPKKPDPTSCNTLMRTLNVRNDEAVFVGDSDVDIQIAKNSKAFSIGCGWGFRGGQELITEGADYVIHDAIDIVEVINMLNKRSLKRIMEEAELILENLEK